ncbi:bacteriophage holin [uncultured Hymenobacter sp.]|uniref:bacteriophage holin n=1 Tax=uncultured Hymenobacter sp. TaxID=170016 RepID=UPI0035CB98A2
MLLVINPRMQEALATGLSLSPWVLLVRTYLFDDWQFLGFLLTLVVVDTVTGVLRGWQKRQVSSRAFSRFFVKLLVYLSLLILAHVMTSFTIKGEVNVFFQWFDTFVYCAMMARETLSVLENLATIAPEFVPKVLLKRLALFSEDPEAALRGIKPAEPVAEPQEEEYVSGCAGKIDVSHPQEEGVV